MLNTKTELFQSVVKEACKLAQKYSGEPWCESVNSGFNDMKPIEIILLTVATMASARYAVNFACYAYSNLTINNIKIGLFRFAAKYIPQARAKLTEEGDKMEQGAIKKFHDARKPTSIPKLPEEGRNPA